MQTLSAVNFSQNIFDILDRAIINHEPFNVKTDNGSAVIINSEDYSGMQETLYLLSIPGMKEKLLAGMNEPLSECVPEEEVEW